MGFRTSLFPADSLWEAGAPSCLFKIKNTQHLLGWFKENALLQASERLWCKGPAFYSLQLRQLAVMGLWWQCTHQRKSWSLRIAPQLCMMGHEPDCKQFKGSQTIAFSSKYQAFLFLTYVVIWWLTFQLIRTKSHEALSRFINTLLMCVLLSRSVEVKQICHLLIRMSPFVLSTLAAKK